MTKKLHLPARRMSFAWLSSCFIVWVVAVSFLSIERQLRHDMHVQWMIHMRQAINTFFASDEAFANIEHLLFGVATATMAIMLITVAQDPQRLAPTTPPPRWKSALRRGASKHYHSFRLAISSSLLWICPSASPSTRDRIAGIGRLLAAAATPALLLSLTWKIWAYGVADIAIVVVVALVFAGAAWRPRKTLATVKTRPALMASIVSLPVWLHFEGVWKLERIENHLNTLGHVARHGTLSAGACCATLLAFHVVVSRPYTTVPGIVSFEHDV